MAIAKSKVWMWLCLITFSFILPAIAAAHQPGAIENPTRVELIDPRPPSSYLLTDVVITLERTRCYGTCSAYKVQIFGDGRVRYEGYWNVKEKGVCSATIQQKEVFKLLKYLYAIRFFERQSRYAQIRVPFVDDGVVEVGFRAITDQQTQIITVQLGAYEKRIELYAFVPTDLAGLPSKIDTIAGTDKWVQHKANHPFSLEPCS